MSQAREYKKGKDLCPNCRYSKRLFYVEDGLTFCKRCDFLQEVATQTEVLGDGIRPIRQTTRKRKESVEKVSRIYRGASARELFLQAYQLILRKQCNTLVRVMGLPDEFEHVVKNLWALRLQLLKDSVDAVSNDENLFSSQPQKGEGEGEVENMARRRKLDKAMPSLIDSLGICYFGAMLLRLPIGVGEFHRWVSREELLFTRAIRIVPAIIKEKLPAEYIMALDTTSALETDQIRDAVDELGRFYSNRFTISLPPLNAPLLLFKFIKSLALPISLFPVVRKLSALLSIDFSFPQHGQRRAATAFPEASLISLLVVAVKLYHPFDEIPRSAVSFEDPAILKIDWSQWVEAQKHHEATVQAGSYLARGSEMHITEEDVVKMSGDQMDDYMNWFERTWTDEDRARHKIRPLHEDFRKWFPITGKGSEDSTSSLDHAEQVSRELHSTEQFSTTVMRTMQLRNVVTEPRAQGLGSNVMNVGSRYRRYRTRQDLPSQALVFHEFVANATGSSLETLLRTVLSIEQRLMEQRAPEPKRGRNKKVKKLGSQGVFDNASIDVNDTQ